MKFEVDDVILQISATPDMVCYTGYDKGPSIGTITKITPKMYRIDFDGDAVDIPIGDVEREFVNWSQEREDQLLKVYTDMRTTWSKLYIKQIDFIREDR